MIIRQKLGSLKNKEVTEKDIEKVFVEWHEADKRILHKKTDKGRDITCKFLNENQQLTDDDVLYEDEHIIIMVEILPTKCMTFKPASMYEMALICYELGNKHLPLYYEDEQLIMPFDMPVHNMLIKSGMNIYIEEKKLLQRLRTSVSPHEHSSNNSLFNKILKLTS